MTEPSLRRLLVGFQVTQAIHVAAVLGIPDLLAERAHTSAELADAAGADPDALHRLLRALAAAEVVREEEDGFSLAPLGERLRSDAPDSLAGWASNVGRPYYWNTWSSLLHSVRTGENAFAHLHGTDVWEYRSRHPEDAAAFDAAMTALTRNVNRDLLDAYDFGRFGVIVDVGGNRGALLAAILQAHPQVRGMLFDQPHVVARAPELLAEAGVADRVHVEAGSFFEAVPAGGDAYVLKSIVHDWEDEEALAILRTVRRAIPAEGTLLVVERVLAPPNEGLDGKLSDLNMLVMPGGRERTVDEYAALLERAGFELAGVASTGTMSVVEGRPRA
jgi:hypothetical protein